MAKPNAESTFRAKAPGIMAQLIPDFPITPDDAAAILGNLGHESAGLTTLQEIKPTVAGNSLGTDIRVIREIVERSAGPPR